MSPIGPIIKDFRQKRGLSLNQVAMKSEMDKSYLSKIENEKRDPSLSSLHKISKAIDVPLNILILMTEEDTKGPFAELTEVLKATALDIVSEQS